MSDKQIAEIDTMDFAIEINHLNKSFSTSFFSKKQILNSVSFSIYKKSITGFIGSNGSGKTTTIKSILGFIFPDSKDAQIKYFGEKEITSSIRRKIGYMPERPYLPEHLTAKDFLKYHWDLLGLRGGFESKVTEILQRLDLKNVEDRRLQTFSKGMLQRIGLAQALLGNPELLILDEPMSGLDPDGRWLIKELIKEENKKGTTIFFSSHLLSDMDELCSQIVVIDQGKIVYSGSAAQFARGDAQTFILSYFVKGQQMPSSEIVMQSQLATRIAKIQEGGGEILKINPQHAGIEFAFAQLRHKVSEQG